MSTDIAPMKVLIVDDEADIRESLQEIIADEGHACVQAGSEAEALPAAAGADLALVDIKLGNDNGLEILQKLKAEWPQMPVVMITGFGTVALAAQAFKLGAHDFLEKPLRLVQVRSCVRNALEGVRLRRSLARQALGTDLRAVYQSEPMKQLYRQAGKLTNVKQPVVIMGPSGSGKELLARFLHFEGSRAQGPFVVTNAASMPVTLAEDELFGHEKGAFTSADRRRIGCLEQAAGGTLFLDEIGDLDPQIQAKLLRVLESGEVTRLGANASLRVDVRLVCATHKDLEALVRQGAFRHDLWYRISAFVLRIPPLEERRDDIALLAGHFLAAMNAELGVARAFSAAALEALKGRSYPGNVRELKHVVARAAVYAEGEEIDARDVELQPGPAVSQALQSASADGVDYTSMDFRDARIAFEINYLRAVLKRHSGNITASARAIGMAQSNLSRKLKELGIRE